MTATLAAELTAANRHMRVVRDEYERTKADHALPDGCDNCTRGLVGDSIDGWGYDLDADQLLCPYCNGERRKLKKLRRSHCNHNHELTDDNTYYEARQPHVGRCLTCRRDRSRRGHVKRQAAKVAARG